MIRVKLSMRLVIWIMGVTLALAGWGCAKKQVVKEESTVKPAMEAKPEIPKVVEKAKEESKPEAPKVVEKPVIPEKPKETSKLEAAPKMVEEPPSIDWASLHIQFAFDDYTLSEKARGKLAKIASWMSKNSMAKIRIEGHACEIGTNEYNLALGERRANSAKRYLETLGVSPARIAMISFGEEKPLDPGHTEEARSKNRRDQFVPMN